MDNKMCNNQRHIMPINWRKSIANEEQSNHLSKEFEDFNSSQQTTWNECQYSESFTDLEVSDRENRAEEILKSVCEKSDERPLMKECCYSVHQGQLHKGLFLSASKLYEIQVLQKRQSHPHSTPYHHNYFLKCHQTNLKHLSTKLSIIRQLLHPRHHIRFYQISEKLAQSPIRYDKIDEMEITFFKCECQFVTISQKSFKDHLKKKSHKVYLWISTQKERRNQQRFYKKTVVEDNGKLDGFFNPWWLYKSFEVIFVQGGLHWELHQIKTSIRVELGKMKIQLLDTDKLMNQFDSMETIEDGLKKKWKKIYVKLHKLHNSNQQICHKCMSIDEHLYLFALAIVQIIKKCNLIFEENKQQEKTKCQVFSNLIKIILMGFLDRRFKQQIDTKNNIPKLLEYHSTRKMLLKLLRNYIQTFDYIDLYELSTTFDRQTFTI